MLCNAKSKNAKMRQGSRGRGKSVSTHVSFVVSCHLFCTVTVTWDQCEQISVKTGGIHVYTWRRMHEPACSSARSLTEQQHAGVGSPQTV